MEERERIIECVRELLESHNAKRAKIGFVYGFYWGTKIREILLEGDSILLLSNQRLLYDAEYISIDILIALYHYLFEDGGKIEYVE